MDKSRKNIWHQLLTIAVYAPSINNSQPWKVKLLPTGEAQIFIDKDRIFHNLDPTGRLAILSMGTFIESLKITAANHALSVSVELSAPISYFNSPEVKRTDKKLILFAALRLTPNLGATIYYSNRLFLKRQTSRLKYNPNPISEKVTNRILEISKNWNIRYDSIKDAEKINLILEEDTENYLEILISENSEELIKWFRLSEDESQKNNDGLDFKCMNISRTSFWSSAKLTKGAKISPLRKMIKKNIISRLGDVHTLGIFSADFDSSGVFSAGRFLMHFWLEMAKNNIFIHPMGSILMNREKSNILKKITGIDNIFFLFRIGYSEKPSKSLRKPLKDIILLN